jgi:O-antigen ligase
VKLIYDPAVPQKEFLLKTELRRIYGLGPDMFVHSYPMAVSPVGFLEVQPSLHNIVLRVLVTIGLLGFVALSIVGYGILIIVVNLITRLKRGGEIQPALLITAVFLAMVVGKFIEMQTGVSRVSVIAYICGFWWFGGQCFIGQGSSSSTR